MPKCKECGEEVVYITTVRRICMVCNPVEEKVILRNGQIVSAYRFHNNTCIGKNEHEDQLD